VFFAGATHNSVANAALIGSLAPFLIVPVGAWLFAEYIDPRALVFAVLAFGGVALVLFSAPPNGDASLEGNVFGFLAMLLLVAYVAATRHYRRGMDVTTFMATICPIATVAVLPLALAHGDVLGMSGTGWTYTLILTLTSGVAAQGLLVYAQKTIQIGTIAIAQVAQPALAVVWSYLLLAEVINARQAIGIAIVMGGLLAFVLLNQRRPVPLGDEVRGGRHPPVGLLGPRERVEREDLDRRVVVAARGVEQRLEPRAGAGVAVARVERGQQALAQRRLLAAAGLTVPGARRRECRPRRRDPAQRAQHAPEVHPRERGEPHVAGRLRLLDRELERGRAGLVVTGLALRAAEARELVCLGLLEAEAAGGRRGAADVEDRVAEAMLDPCELAEHRVPPDVEPWIVDLAQPALDLVAGRRRRAHGRRPRSPRGRRRARSPPGPTRAPGRRRCAR
jgi:uncharacterized membrane protein